MPSETSMCIGLGGPDNNEMKRTKHGLVGASPLISVFAGLTVDRCLRLLALVSAAAIFGACAHVGRHRVLTKDEQLVVSALSWAVRVPPRAVEYAVVLPASYPADAIMAAAATDTRLWRRGRTLRRNDEGGSRDMVLITIQRPQHAPPPVVREVLVPFTFAVGGAEPTACVVRIRLTGDDPRSWLLSAEGEEHCWTRPGAWATP
jgi:hypothetical protein